jgi:transposase-like protein
VQVTIKHLSDAVQCYQTVRELRWPSGIECPSYESKQIIKRGFDDTEPARQRYECHDGNQRFDDLTATIFAGHHHLSKGGYGVCISWDSSCRTTKVYKN